MLLKRIYKSVKGGELRKVMLLLVAAMAMVGALPNVSGASVIPADEVSGNQALRTENMAKIKVFLERKEVASRLSDYGLTPQEVETRMDKLSDEQVSEVATKVDGVSEGGDVVELLVAILLILLIVWLVLRLTSDDEVKLVRSKS